jgi:hypothetical protein
MELIVMIGIVFFFGAVILSTVAQRSGPPAPPVFVVRADSLERGPASESGLSIFVLLLVIAAAIWLL